MLLFPIVTFPCLSFPGFISHSFPSYFTLPFLSPAVGLTAESCPHNGALFNARRRGVDDAQRNVNISEEWWVMDVEGAGRTEGWG